MTKTKYIRLNIKFLQTGKSEYNIVDNGKNIGVVWKEVDRWFCADTEGRGNRGSLTRLDATKCLITNF